MALSLGEVSMGNLEKLIAELREARTRATQQEWEPCGCRFSIATSYLNPQEHLDIADFAVADMMPNAQAEMNMRFSCLAANKIEILLEIIELLRHGNAEVIRNSSDILAKKSCSRILAEVERLAEEPLISGYNSKSEMKRG
jgi:hypothetical protein